MAGDKRVPLGKAIIWSPAELQRMSQVTPADIRQMRLWWRKHAPSKYRRLLDAESWAAQRGRTN